MCDRCTAPRKPGVPHEQPYAQDQPGPEISPTETYQAAADTLLLDVRGNHEWTVGYAPRAQHMPLSSLDISALNPHTPIIALCRSGNRSGKAAPRLSEAAFAVQNMTGGMGEWEKLGLPGFTDDGSPGTIA